MFFCDNCNGKRFASRTLYLIHLSTCTKGNSSSDERSTDKEDTDSNEVSQIIMLYYFNDNVNVNINLLNEIIILIISN